MSESDEKRRKREKKEKKARKEKKRDKAASSSAAAPSNAHAARRQGLEEVFEDDDEYGAQRGHSERYDDAADDDEDGPRHSLSGGSNQRGLSGLAASSGAHSSRRSHHGHHSQQHLDMDDLDGRGGGGHYDDDGDDDGGHQQGRHNVRLHGGMELDDGLEEDDPERLDLDGTDGMDDAAELDLDYHPPPPKTGQQVALAGVALFAMGLAEMFTFAYMCTASEVWSLVVSAAMLLIVGSLGLRAASDGSMLSATYYRISLQVYMVVLLVLAGMNVLFLQLQSCIAPCVSTDPARCVQPEDAHVTCSHVLVNTLAVSVFGLFFPCFLFLLPCYLGSGIHLENLTAQAAAAGPAGQKQERQGLMYREDAERKY